MNQQQNQGFGIIPGTKPQFQPNNAGGQPQPKFAPTTGQFPPPPGQFPPPPGQFPPAANIGNQAAGNMGGAQPGSFAPQPVNFGQPKGATMQQQPPVINPQNKFGPMENQKVNPPPADNNQPKFGGQQPPVFNAQGPQPPKFQPPNGIPNQPPGGIPNQQIKPPQFNPPIQPNPNNAFNPPGGNVPMFQAGQPPFGKPGGVAGNPPFPGPPFAGGLIAANPIAQPEKEAPIPYVSKPIETLEDKKNLVASLNQYFMEGNAAHAIECIKQIIDSDIRIKAN